MVFAERFITGDEYTVGVLQGQALPSIRIVPATEFFTTTRPSISATTPSITALSGIDAAAETELRGRRAFAAFGVTDCYGWGRVDFMRDRATGKFYGSSRSTPRPA